MRNPDFIIMCAKYRYMLHRILLRIKMGKTARNDYIQKERITYLEFLPEIFYAGKVCEKDGIRAVPRAHTDDFYVLFIEKENELKSHLTMHSGESFVDVGSNVGYYSLRIAKDYGKGVKVIAIEAHPKNYEALLRNISCSKLENIETFNKAVSDHTGIIPIYEHSNKHYTGQFSINARSEDDKPSGFEVECDTLDNILVGRQCNVLKIDIEGEEVNALKAAEETLKKTRKVMVEIHGENLPQVKSLLENRGFAVEITGAGVMKYAIGSK